MSHALRTIAFATELIHAPLKHEPKKLQSLHAALFERDDSSYRDFRLVAGGAQLSNASGVLPGAPVSCVNLLADRIQIREEQTGAGVDDFMHRLSAVAELALSNLDLASFLVQQYAVRSVVNPDSTDDARAFMLQDVFGLAEGALDAFAAPPTLAGLRLAFPPQGDDAGIFNVRCESFTQDNRSLFLEAIGTFSRPVKKDDTEAITARLQATYGFLHDHLLDFVERLDDTES